MLSNGSQIIMGCPAGASCNTPAPPTTVPIPASPAVYTEAYCAAGPCDADGLRAQVFLRSVQVVLSDEGTPALANVRGLAVQRPWIGGTVQAAFDATGVSGIAIIRAKLDGRVVGASSQTCIPSPKACPNFAGAVDIAMRSLPDGNHTLTLEASGRAGNTGRVDRPVQVDTTPQLARRISERGSSGRRPPIKAELDGPGAAVRADRRKRTHLLTRAGWDNASRAPARRGQTVACSGAEGSSDIGVSRH